MFGAFFIPKYPYMEKNVCFLLLLIVLTNCVQKKEQQMSHKFTNALIEETSPYLLQHAHNPVNWEAWNPKTLERAKQEDKPLLISIGYAACHWCHVMEHECFEDEEVAKIMNENFINIKIDREERPDVDQIYMDAIQMMTGSGGWPLNIVALPDGRPFWGATYLPKESWVNSLNKLTELYKNDLEKVTGYAADLERGIQAINLVENKKDTSIFPMDSLTTAVANWSTYFDTYLGGYKRAPKFMMPNNLDFLLHFATSQNQKDVLDYVDTTLTRMAYGGIFDHVGGGFSRYSVDTKWHVPHFEKMLYDNGQLVSLYSKAFAVSKNPLYKNTAEQSIAFVVEELSDTNGGFYSSLDADSLSEAGELEEGAYYVWKEEELSTLLAEGFELFKDYFNINSYGEWEGNYVLIRDKSNSVIIEEHDITEAVLEEKITSALQKLKIARSKRNKPRLDDKILTSWNGLMLKGLVDAHRYLKNEIYLEIALKNAQFIEDNMLRDSGGLFRNHKNGKSTINGFLEDYATVIEGFLALYEVTFDDHWLFLAKQLTEYSILHFSDSMNGMFFFTSDEDNSLIRRTIESNDNVISASNSIMAHNLLKLHKLFPNEGYAKRVRQMVKNVQDNFLDNGQSFANWLHLLLFEHLNFYEIAVVGTEHNALGREISGIYIPNSVLVGTQKEGTIDLLKGRYNEEETLIYVCIEGSCKLPVTSVNQMLEQL